MLCVYLFVDMCLCLCLLKEKNNAMLIECLISISRLAKFNVKVQLLVCLFVSVTFFHEADRKVR